MMKRIRAKWRYKGVAGIVQILFGLGCMYIFVFIGDLIGWLAICPPAMFIIISGIGFIQEEDVVEDILIEEDLQKFRQAETYFLGVLGLVLGLPAWFYLLLLNALQYGLNFKDPYVYGISLFIIIGYIQLLAIKMRESFGNRLRSCPCCGEERHTLEGILTHIEVCESNSKFKS